MPGTDARDARQAFARRADPDDVLVLARRDVAVALRPIAHVADAHRLAVIEIGEQLARVVHAQLAGSNRAPACADS
jgi:hypothetical protein